MSDPRDPIEYTLRRLSEHYGVAQADLTFAEASHRAAVATGVYLDEAERDLRYRRAVVENLRAMLAPKAPEKPQPAQTKDMPPRTPPVQVMTLGEIRRILGEMGATTNALSQTPADLLRAVRDWRGGAAPPDSKYTAMLDAVEANLERMSREG